MSLNKKKLLFRNSDMNTEFLKTKVILEIHANHANGLNRF